MTMRTLGTRLVALTALCAILACDGSTAPVEPTTVREYLTGIVTADRSVTAAYRMGLPPAAGVGPTITVTSASGFITGGTAILNVSGSGTFTSLIVAIGGLAGYYELTFANPVTAAQLLLSVAMSLPGNSFTLEYAGGTGGSFGTFGTRNVQAVPVGTGAVQVSLSWNSPADMDLYVIEPDGSEIFYGQASSRNGGVLDLDSNAGCVGDDVRNENITYLTTPPRGTYTVRVNHFKSCGSPSTTWVATVRNGMTVQTYTGTVTGLGEGGAAGAGVTIATLTR